jgi:Tat protein translocase TatB subunit
VLQGQEIFVILLVALVVLGPSRLPEVARKMGGWVAELRKAAREIREGLEAEVSEVKELADEISAPLKEVSKEMSDAAKFADDPGLQPTTPSPPKAPDASADAAAENEMLRKVVDREAPRSTSTARSWVGPKPVSGPSPEDALDDLRQIEETGEAATDTPEAQPDGHGG